MTSIIFLVSLCGVAIMLLLKVVELRIGEIEQVSTFFRKCDTLIHAFFREARTRYETYRKIALLFVFDFLPRYAFEMTTKLRDYIARKYYMAGTDFRGKRVLRSDGSVSSFLQELSAEHTTPPTPTPEN